MEACSSTPPALRARPVGLLPNVQTGQADAEGADSADQIQQATVSQDLTGGHLPCPARVQQHRSAKSKVS